MNFNVNSLCCLAMERQEFTDLIGSVILSLVLGLFERLCLMERFKVKEKEPILMVVGEDDYNLEAETHLMCVVSPHFSCCSLHETDGVIRVPADNTPLVCMEDTYHTPLEFCYQSLSYHQQCRDVVAGCDTSG